MANLSSHPLPEGSVVDPYTGAEIRAIRSISLLAALAYPIFWWVHRTGGAVELDPLPLRLGVSAYALCLTALSFRRELAQRHMHGLALGLVHLVTIHFFVLLTLNDLHWEFVVGVLLVLIGMSAGASLGFRTRRSLYPYLGELLAGTAISAALATDPVVPIPYYVSAMLVATLTVYLGVGAHLDAREEILAGRRRLETVLTGAPVALWSTDRDGRVDVVEGRGFERLGMRPAQMVGRPLSSVVRDRPELAPAFRSATEGRDAPTTFEHAGAIFETWHAPLRGVDGEIAGTVGVLTDVTEAHRMNESLRQSQKMEAIGRLAGGIAHDFNNILTAVLGYAQLARSEVAAGGIVADSLDEIRVASERAASLVRQLLAFSRQQPMEPERRDLDALVRSMTSMLRPLIGQDLILETRLPGSAPPIAVDPNGIEQVLMNLAVNARDACPNGGRLVISTGVETIEAGSTAPGTDGPRPGRYAVLEVSDDGEGIDAETLEKIFDPFFTTKPFGRGSGMGLATVYGIVEQNGGTITVDSARGEGTTFTIRLPAADGADPPAPMG